MSRKWPGLSVWGSISTTPDFPSQKKGGGILVPCYHYHPCHAPPAIPRPERSRAQSGFSLRATSPRPVTCHGVALPVHERERSTEKYSEVCAARRRRRLVDLRQTKHLSESSGWVATRQLNHVGRATE